MNEVEIIHDEHGLVIVNKPSGLAVHNGEVNLIDLLEAELDERLKPVNRLDQETSGLIVLARGASAAASLQRSLALPESQKSYLAVTRGQPKSAQGEWRFPISPKSEGRKNPSGKRQDRVEAHTGFEVLTQNKWLALIRCRLFTGRQHQIRKHACLAGCHLVGDRRYGDPKHARMIAQRYRFEGLALHSAHLLLSYEGERFEFEAPIPAAWSCFGLT